MTREAFYIHLNHTENGSTFSDFTAGCHST
jgi:hypothetical protein